MQTIPNGSVTSPQGFLAGAAYAGLKTAAEGQRDVGILFSEAPCCIAGVFTTNKFRAPPVHWCQERVAQGQAQAVVVNSGNANAGTGVGTGQQGYRNTAQMAALAADVLGLTARDVLVASTGVIGVPLPMHKLHEGIKSIHLSRESGHEFVRAIITTDTFPKEIAVAVSLAGGRGVIGGAAKGAGMIHPNMATMLSFVTTDLAVEPGFLQRALRTAADLSFNMITVDGDTSTNDTLLVMANGQAGNEPVREGTPDAAAFQEALNYVCIYLAKCVARDGEGATKLIEVRVQGAASERDARLAARTVAGSMLVKAAVYGNDPNWGRIAMAAGRSGAELEQEKVDIFIGDVCLMRDGQPQDYDPEAARLAISQQEVLLKLDLHLGSGKATAWGCDLTQEYVRLNAEYTT